MLGLRRYKKTQIDIWQGDILAFAVDAMISPTDGGPLKETLILLAGPEALKAWREDHNSAVGGTFITSAGSLPATHIIHAPCESSAKDDRDQATILRDALNDAFLIADGLSSCHVSCPGVPLAAQLSLSHQEMAEIYFSLLKKFLDESQSRDLRRVTFVAHDAIMYGILQQNLFLRFPDELDEEGF